MYVVHDHIIKFCQNNNSINEDHGLILELGDVLLSRLLINSLLTCLHVGTYSASLAGGVGVGG